MMLSGLDYKAGFVLFSFTFSDKADDHATSVEEAEIGFVAVDDWLA